VPEAFISYPFDEEHVLMPGSIFTPYESYAKWKEWKLNFTTSDRDDRYFSGEFATIVRGGQRIVEIGFGAGSFMAWAKQRGAEVYGVEIQQTILDAAVRYGFVAVSDLEQLAPYKQEGFDVVVALDVFEHLSIDEIRKMLSSIDNLLKPSGILIIRSPNGDSPFSLFYQHGDATHANAITPAILTQLSLATNLQVSEVRNEARVPLRSGWLHATFKRAQFLLRECTNQAVARIYGYPHAFLDPNIIIILRKSE
jgi:2-polyprenyl-3-methyl-5-hydroxy-6-metoxy-1,4-benzoquinol methylase